MPILTKFASSYSGFSWSNPTNAYADDGVYTTLSFPYSSPSYLYLFNFAFNLPTFAVINSITVEAKFKVSTTASTANFRLAVTKGTTLRGTELVDSTEPTSDKIVTLTTVGSWTASELNDNTASGFQVRVGGDRGSSMTAVTGSVDYVKVSIDYTIPTFNTLGELPAGSNIYLNETVNGVTAPRQYTVLANDYPTTDGTLLLRNKIDNQNDTACAFNTTSTNVYSGSVVDLKLQAFASRFDAEIQGNLIDAPLSVNGGIINRKTFLLSSTEMGNTDTTSYPVEGTLIPYFASATQRIGYSQLNNTALNYWTRTLQKSISSYAAIVSTSGSFTIAGVTTATSYYIRPALVLPKSTSINPEPDANGIFSLILSPVVTGSSTISGQLTVSASGLVIKHLQSNISNTLSVSGKANLTMYGSVNTVTNCQTVVKGTLIKQLQTALTVSSFTHVVGTIVKGLKSSISLKSSTLSFGSIIKFLKAQIQTSDIFSVKANIIKLLKAQSSDTTNFEATVKEVILGSADINDTNTVEAYGIVQSESRASVEIKLTSSVDVKGYVVKPLASNIQQNSSVTAIVSKIVPLKCSVDIKTNVLCAGTTYKAQSSAIKISLNTSVSAKGTLIKHIKSDEHHRLTVQPTVRVVKRIKVDDKEKSTATATGHLSANLKSNAHIDNTLTSSLRIEKLLKAAITNETTVTCDGIAYFANDRAIGLMADYIDAINLNANINNDRLLKANVYDNINLKGTYYDNVNLDAIFNDTLYTKG
jgi:hypothetical protein